MKKIIVEEEEKNQISSQHEEIDSRLFNFLIRRLKVEERNLGGDYGVEFEPLIVIEYTFEGYPGYGFNTFHTKREMERFVVDMLWEEDVINIYPYSKNEQDPERVKIMKTIRKFLNFILSSKK
jgi:hypothetical protein